MMKHQHPWIRKISYHHVDWQPPWNSIGKQGQHQDVQTYSRQVFYDFIVSFTNVQPCFGDGYKIHVYLSHVIRKNIGFVANWAGVDNAQFDRHRDTAARAFVIGRRHGGHNNVDVDSRFTVIHRWWRCHWYTRNIVIINTVGVREGNCRSRGHNDMYRSLFACTPTTASMGGPMECHTRFTSSSPGSIVKPKVSVTAGP